MARVFTDIFQAPVQLPFLRASIPKLFTLYIFLAFAPIAAAQGTIKNVDVEIVLAVDASGSINRNELQLQLNGIASAFRNPLVLETISKGVHQSIAVAMLIWSDAGYPKYPTEWFIVNSPQSAELFSKRVESFNNRHGALTAIGGGGTGLGDGLAFALNMLEINGITALRKIVDVSGDGPETIPWSKGAIILPIARNIALTNKTIVNGLAIETDDANLSNWYRQNLISGPGSFTITASRFEDYARAIRLKLIREFSPVAIGFHAPNYSVPAQTIMVKN